MTLHRFRAACWAAILSVASMAGARADVTLPRVLSDNMVLQQKRPIHIWGWAGKGERVSVTFRGRTATSRAEGGRWSVILPPAPAGGPWEMTVAGKNRISLKKILVGEVWVCSGQSNMQFPLSMASNAKEAMAASGDDGLRLFSVPPSPKSMSGTPLEDEATGQWAASDPSTVPGFTAVGYFFGRALRQALHVPIGLINVSWGGTTVEAWTSGPVYEAERIFDYKWRYEPNAPSVLFNGMIAPITPLSIQGVIWYQGESNAAEWMAYRTRFPAMISDWRDDFKQGDFPFLLVQIAPFTRAKPEPEESYMAGLREAQTLATRVLRRVGMAVITDIGDENDIHPRSKQPVGERLALLARKIAYHEKIVASGPSFRSMRIAGNRAIVRFDNVGSGLEARGGALTGFAVAGKDHKYHWADAAIKGDTVELTSASVAHPLYVRFGWASYPVVNLWNKEGLPAVPFRTDGPTE